MLYIGIDNGVSGSIGAVTEDGAFIFWARTPTKADRSYTKEKKHIQRVDYARLRELLSKLVAAAGVCECVRVLLERPMINPGRFQATVSASRALESTLIALEESGLAQYYAFIDSRSWQHELLPSSVWDVRVGARGQQILSSDPERLKRASKEQALSRFPTAQITTDGDALLIALYGRAHPELFSKEKKCQKKKRRSLKAVRTTRRSRGGRCSRRGR